MSQGKSNGQSNGTAPYREHENRPSRHEDPDVLLDVPVVKVDEIELEVENLEARVSLQAAVLDLLKLNVGADVALGKVQLTIKGVEAQALLKVRLDNVNEIISRVLTTIDENPQILEPITRSVGSAVQDVGTGARTAVGDLGAGAGEGVRHIGRGAGDGVRDISRGAGEGVRDVGRGTGETVQDIGRGAGETVHDVGRGAGESVQDVGRGAGEGVRGMGRGAGEGVRDMGRGAGEGVRHAGRGVNEPVRDLRHGAGGVAREAGNGSGQGGRDDGRATGGGAHGLEDGAGDGANRRETPDPSAGDLAVALARKTARSGRNALEQLAGSFRPRK